MLHPLDNLTVFNYRFLHTPTYECDSVHPLATTPANVSLTPFSVVSSPTKQILSALDFLSPSTLMADDKCSSYYRSSASSLLLDSVRESRSHLYLLICGLIYDPMRHVLFGLDLILLNFQPVTLFSDYIIGLCTVGCGTDLRPLLISWQCDTQHLFMAEGQRQFAF